MQQIQFLFLKSYKIAVYISCGVNKVRRVLTLVTSFNADSWSSLTPSTKNGEMPMEEMCRTAVSVSVWMLSSSAINDTTSASLLYSVSTLFSRTSFVCARFFRMFPTYPSNNKQNNFDSYESFLVARTSTIGHLERAVTSLLQT